VRVPPYDFSGYCDLPCRSVTISTGRYDLVTVWMTQNCCLRKRLVNRQGTDNPATWGIACQSEKSATWVRWCAFASIMNAPCSGLLARFYVRLTEFALATLNRRDLADEAVFERFSKPVAPPAISSRERDRPEQILRGVEKSIAPPP